MLKFTPATRMIPNILKKETITIAGAGTDAAAQRADKRNKQVIFKNFAPFTIHFSQVDYAKDLNVVMPIYNLIEYSNIYAKTPESLRQYHKDAYSDPITYYEHLSSRQT